jgi:hypothetical protein
MNGNTESDGYLTPPQLARKWKVGVQKILAWIHSGELRAVNLATRPGGRPRYRICPEDVELFEQARSVSPTPKVARSPKKKPLPPGWVNYV